jgi:hypothetical protein
MTSVNGQNEADIGKALIQSSVILQSQCHPTMMIKEVAKAAKSLGFAALFANKPCVCVSCLVHDADYICVRCLSKGKYVFVCGIVNSLSTINNEVCVVDCSIEHANQVFMEEILEIM